MSVLTPREVAERLGLRLTEAALALGVHPDTLRSWLEAGEFPGRKVRETWLVSPAAVKDFLGGYDEDRARSQRGDAVLPDAGQPVGGEGVDAGRQSTKRVPSRQGGGQASPGRADPAARRRRKARRSQDDGWSVPPKVA